MGALRSLLGRSWGGLGLSWAVLGRSWGMFGWSWAVLGLLCRTRSLQLAMGLFCRAGSLQSVMGSLCRTHAALSVFSCSGFEPCLGLVFALFRPKFGPRRLLKLLFLKNHDFHADLRFPMFFHQNRPQDEAKIGLRSPQDSSKTDLNRSKNRPQIARSLLGDSWAILG